MAGRRRTSALLLGTALLGTALLVAGCSTLTGAIQDPGPPQTQTRTVPSVAAVELATSGELTLAAGTSPTLRITAGRDVIDHLTSEVAGNRLVLGSDGSVHNLGRVRYELAMPAADVVELSGSGTVEVTAPSQLHGLTLSGSGDVTVHGLTTEELVVELSGSGRIGVAGSASRQRISLSGSGQYSAAGLTSEAADVTIGGSGSADLQVSGTLHAVITGSGSVSYRGGAVVTSEVTGSGAVVHG